MLMTRVAVLTLVLSLALAAGVAAEPKEKNAGNDEVDLNATLKAVKAENVGACPLTVAFTGTITGKPGTNVTYQFNRVIGGAKSSTPPASGTLTGGILNVADSFPVLAGQAGVETNELEVNGGDAKASASTTVTCLQPTASPTATAAPTPPSLMPLNPSVISVIAPNPTPTPEFGGGMGMGVTLQEVIHPVAAPTGLTNTTDTGVCAAHFPVPLVGGLACAAAIQNLLALIWNWKPWPNCNTCPTTVNGYKIYRVDGGQHALVADQNQGTNVTAYGLDKPNDGIYFGKCYAATAYKGNMESLDSNKFCVGGNVAIGTVTQQLSPTHVRSSIARSNKNVGFLCQGSYDDVSSASDLEVGWHYTELPAGGDICWWHYSKWAHGGMYFDLSPLAGKKVMKATLRLNSANTEWQYTNKTIVLTIKNNDYRSAAGFTCTTEIGTGRNEWWTNTDWIDLDYVSDVPTVHQNGQIYFSKTPVTLDVTKQISQIVGGMAPNYGFVLKSNREGYQNIGDDMEECMSSSIQSALTVEYFP